MSVGMYLNTYKIAPLTYLTKVLPAPFQWCKSL